MKKFLSLVLALVMTMSLVTISAGAKDFTDNDKVTYDDAVQVVSMLGIVNGYEDGSFKPANTLTRGAAAKIIANFKLTPAVADALKGSETTFKDVPSTNVFSGYIAYCASEGIIAGYGDGTFKPAGTLTANAFMKMLIGALGYDTTTYVGDNFATKVALKVKELGLAEGNTFVGTKALTREEACLYVFNALSENGVYYEGGSSVTINGVNIVTGATEKEYKDTYGERVFGLKSTSTTDVYGRPAIKYTAGKASVTVAETPVLSYKGKVSAKTLFADFQLGRNDEVTVNGTDINKTNSTNTDALFGTGVNTATYIYATKTEGVYEAYVISYTVGEVTKVNPANAKKETERNIVVAGKTYDTELFAKGDVVLYTLVKGEIADVIAADSVEGSITAKKGGSYTIAGKPYAAAADVKLTVGSQGTYYLSLDGTTVVLKDESKTAASSDLYAYVYNKQTIQNGVDENGFPIADATKVYFVKADGTKDSALLKEGTVEAGKVYNYAITDGKFEVIAEVGAADTTKLDNTRVIVDGKDSYLATASTKYVFVNVANNKLTVNTVTGYANAKTAKDSAIYAVADNNNRAITVFVTGTAAGVEADGLYAFLLDAEAVETKDGDDTIYTFSVYGGTLKTNSKTVADAIAAIGAGNRFSYKTADGYVTEAKIAEADVKDAEVKDVVAGDYFIAGTKALTFASDVAVYVNGETLTEGSVENVVAGATVSVWLNAKGEASIIVVTPAED